MKLEGLREFYAAVTSERLEQYLSAHGWKPTDDVAYGGAGVLLGRWWQHGATVLPVATRAAGDWVARNADAVQTLAAVEKRQPTAVLYDLLPSDDGGDDLYTDRGFALECFPQLATPLSTQG